MLAVSAFYGRTHLVTVPSNLNVVNALFIKIDAEVLFNHLCILPININDTSRLETLSKKEKKALLSFIKKKYSYLGVRNLKDGSDIL
jgi:hypothetical protein